MVLDLAVKQVHLVREVGLLLQLALAAALGAQAVGLHALVASVGAAPVIAEVIGLLSIAQGMRDSIGNLRLGQLLCIEARSSSCAACKDHGHAGSSRVLVVSPQQPMPPPKAHESCSRGQYGACPTRLGGAPLRGLRLDCSLVIYTFTGRSLGCDRASHLIRGRALRALPGRAQPSDAIAEGGRLVRVAVAVACAAVAAAAVTAAIACALSAARAARQRCPHWRPADVGHRSSHICCAECRSG